MEVKATLLKPYEEHARYEFIVENNIKKRYIIQEDDEKIQALWYTEEELAQIQREQEKNLEIEHYKELLAESDYKAIKFAEGLISPEDYEPIKQLRQSYRNKINELEGD